MDRTIWHPRNQAIVVGVSLDKAEDHLLQSAVALARKLESPLELVHATQPIFNYMGAGDVVVNPYYGYDRTINDLEDAQAHKALAKIRQSLPEDLQIGLHVLRDYTSEALTSLATEVKAGLIVCGISQGAGHNLLEGMATAFSLASHADVPVLVLPLGAPLGLSESPRLLVADNLQDEGQKALEVAIEFGLALNCKEFCHTHVHMLSNSAVEHMVDKVQEAMNLGKIPLNPEFSTSAYTEQLRAQISADLRARFLNSPGAESISDRYETLVSFGKPAAELHRITLLLRPQLLVFGRHHLFHRQRFSLGKIPYEAMMEEGVATLIVPDTITKAEARG